MKTLFSVGKLVNHLSLEDQLILAKKAGFDGIDYISTIRDLYIPPSHISTLSKKHNIPIHGIHVPIALVPYTPRFLYKRMINVVSLFPECKVFNVHLSQFITPIQKSSKNLEIFLQLVEQKNVTFTFESNPNNYRILTYYPKETYMPEVFAAYCINNKLKINLDTSHIATLGYDINEFFIKYHKFINLIHLSDFDEKRQHLPFGKGKLDLKQLFKNMKKLSYKGDIIFELYTFPHQSQEQIQAEVSQSLQLFKAYFK